jgi:hypothetical protein
VGNQKEEGQEEEALGSFFGMKQRFDVPNHLCAFLLSFSYFRQ